MCIPPLHPLHLFNLSLVLLLCCVKICDAVSSLKQDYRCHVLDCVLVCGIDNLHLFNLSLVLLLCCVKICDAVSSLKQDYRCHVLDCVWVCGIDKLIL